LITVKFAILITYFINQPKTLQNRCEYYIISWGHTIVEIELSDMEGRHSEKVKALVDTGATLTTLPKSLADKLGIKSMHKESVRTGAGIITIERGEARIKLYDKEGPFKIWISDFVDKVLLGVVVLQSLGFEVDPIGEKLKPAELLLY